jgi:hypothetical protein
MKMQTIATVVAGALAVAALASAGAATAVVPSGSAADVVKALQDQGYSVEFNGTTNGPLSDCTVTGVHGLTVMMTSDGTLMMKMQPGNPGTVYVDVSCPSSNN